MLLGEFMGFSAWFFNRVLFVCCLVWGYGVGVVGSPRNVGLGSVEGLSGAEEGRRQKTDVETGRVSNIRGKGFGCYNNSDLAPPDLVFQRGIGCSG